MPYYRTRVGSASPKAYRLRQGRWGLEQNFELLIKKGKIILRRKCYRYFDPSREPEAVYVKKKKNLVMFPHWKRIEVFLNAMKSPQDIVQYWPTFQQLATLARKKQV